MEVWQRPVRVLLLRAISSLDSAPWANRQPRLHAHRVRDILEPGRTTGAFEGSDDTSNNILRGTWRSPNDTRRVPFTLTRSPQKVDHQILFTWERRSPESYQAWQAEADYSPTTNQLIYLDQRDILSLFDVSTMKSRRLLKFDSAIRDYAQPEYPAGPLTSLMSSCLMLAIARPSALVHAGDSILKTYI